MGVQALAAQQVQPRDGPGRRRAGRVLSSLAPRSSRPRPRRAAQAFGEVVAAALVVDGGAEPRDLVGRHHVVAARGHQARRRPTARRTGPTVAPQAVLYGVLSRGEAHVAVGPEDLAGAELGLAARRAAPASARGRRSRRRRGGRSSRPWSCRPPGRRRSRRRPRRTRRTSGRRHGVGPRVLPPPCGRRRGSAVVRDGGGASGASSASRRARRPLGRRRAASRGGPGQHLARACARRRGRPARRRRRRAATTHVDPDVAEHAGGRGRCASAR